MYKEKLASLLFFKIENDAIEKLFKIDVKDLNEVFFPLLPSKFANKIVNENGNVSKIPIGLFIEGMFYTLACDENFIYNDIYKYIILKNSDKYFPHIKRKIVDTLKENNNYEAFIMLKGLCQVEDSKENFEKLIDIGITLIDFEDNIKIEIFELIDRVIEEYDYINGYRIKSHIQYNEGKYDEAIVNISKYKENGGKMDENDELLESNLKENRQYEKAKSIMNEEPSKALNMFLEINQIHNSNAMVKLHIAVCYRLLNLNEKAIIFLEEAVSIDSDLLDIYNEFGLNYALIGKFDKSILYFEKAFEVTSSIEICTNLIMSLINDNRIEEAKKYLEKGKKIDPNDEIILDIDSKIDYYAKNK